MARRVEQRAFGGPEVLEIVEVLTPTAANLRSGEVLVRVHAAGLNPVDAQTREGRGVAGLLGEFPFTVGWDIAGVVEAVGADAVDVLVGQRVFGMLPFSGRTGGHAEYVVAPAAALVAIPENLDDVTAAAIPLAALTAWQALQDVAGLQDGERVLILGAGGGVGHLAVQIAAHLGADVVAVAGADKHAWLEGLGASQTIDHRSEDYVEVLGGASVDVVFDLVRDDDPHRALEVLAPMGRLVFSATPVDGAAQAAAEVAAVEAGEVAVHVDRAQLAAVTELFAAGTLTVEISAVFDLDHIRDAHRALESGHTRGKLALRTI